MRGRWRMGSEFGSCVGHLVWVKDVRHVVRFKDASRHVPFIATNESAPWYRYCVGAPKGKPKAKSKSKRGAHLRKDESGSITSGRRATEAALDSCEDIAIASEGLASSVLLHQL